MTRSVAELYEAIAALRERMGQIRASDGDMEEILWSLLDRRGERIAELEAECERLRARLAGAG